MATADLRRPSASAVGKALDLMEAIAGAPEALRLSEAAAEVGLHRATAYRVLGELVERGWVQRQDGRYLPGSTLRWASRQASDDSIAALCRPALEQLADATGMMSNLQVLERAGSRVLDAVRPQRYSMITHLIGEVLPAHRFAGPLALVAALPPERRDPYLRAAADAGHPLDGPGGLRDEIAEAARSCFALVRRRNDQIVASISRAVAGNGGEPICALTVVGLDAEFDDDRLVTIERALVAAADQVQAVLAGSAPQPPGQPDPGTASRTGR